MVKIFSIYDQKAEYWLKPFYEQTAASAFRVFGQAVARENTMFNEHPADFTLFEIGNFDEFTGKLEPHAANFNLGNGLETIGASNGTET